MFEQKKTKHVEQNSLCLGRKSREVRTRYLLTLRNLPTKSVLFYVVALRFQTLAAQEVQL